MPIDPTFIQPFIRQPRRRHDWRIALSIYGLLGLSRKCRRCGIVARRARVGVHGGSLYLLTTHHGVVRSRTLPSCQK